MPINLFLKKDNNAQHLYFSVYTNQSFILFVLCRTSHSRCSLIYSIKLRQGEDLRMILNMDGTQNLTKIKQAGIRDILAWIR